MKKYRILFSKRSHSFLWVLLLSISTVLAQTAINGVVTDEANEPMPGVSVILKGTKTGTVTDVNGRYRISVPQTSSVLQFSFLGYALKEVTVGSKKQINVEMKEDAKMLDEVVAIGYGTVKKNDLTGSVSKVNMDDVTKAAVSSIDQALAGRVAGLQVVATDGRPGATSNLVIRGSNTISDTSDGSPLYVVDGFPMEDPNIAAYSFFIFLNQVIDRVNWSLDQFILGAIVGTTITAIYAVAGQLNSMYMNFSTSISNVMLPHITKMEYDKASNREFTNIFIKTGRLQYILMALIITGFVLFGQIFVNWWAGPGYESTYIIACILMIPMTIPLIQNTGLSILQVKNLYKYRTILFFAIAILNIAISIPLARLYGGIGTAMGTAISLILGQGILLNIYYHKKVGINIIEFWKNILKMSIPIIFAVAFGIFLNFAIISESIVILAIKIILYSIIYFILMWLFGMNNYEKNLIRNPLKRIFYKIRGGNL